MFDYNVDERVESFIKVILLQAGNYRTDHIMFTMGSDFNHENSHEWYKNLDKLMKYTMMKVRFPTIDALDYFIAVDCQGSYNIVAFTLSKRLLSSKPSLTLP